MEATLLALLLLGFQGGLTNAQTATIATPVAKAAPAAGDGCQRSGTLKFWNPTGYTYPGLDQSASIADGFGGTIGVTFSSTSASPFTISPFASANDPFFNKVAGTGDFALSNMAWSNATALRLQEQVGQTMTFDVTLNFAAYKGSAAGASADGKTFSGTYIAISDIYSGLGTGTTTVTFASTGVTFSKWAFVQGGPGHVVSTGANAALNALKFNPATGALTGVPNQPAIGGNGVDVDTTVGLFRMPFDETYTQVKFTVTSQALNASSPMSDLLGFAVATEQITCPTTTTAAAATTTPAPAPATTTPAPAPATTTPAPAPATTTPAPAPATTASACTHSGTLKFWNPATYRYPGIGKSLSIPDGLGGSIGLTFASAATDVFQINPFASLNEQYYSAVKGTGEFPANNVTWDFANAIRMQEADAATAAIQVTLDFTNYKGTAAGATTDGQTFPGTYIGISDIYSGKAVGQTNVTFTMAGATYSKWTLIQGGSGLVVQSGANAGTNKLYWSNGLMRGYPNTPAPGGSLVDVDTTVGLLRLPEDEGYQTVTFTVRSKAAPNSTMGDLFSIAVATENVVCVGEHHSSSFTFTNNVCDPTGDMTFWDAQGFTYTGLNKTVQVNDGLGGSIGVKFSSVMPNPFDIPPFKDPNDQHYAAVKNTGDFLTNNFTWTQGNSIRLLEAKTNAVQFTVELDFANYKASARGAPSDGATFGGTYLAFTDIYSGQKTGSTKIIFTADSNGTVGDLTAWRALQGGPGLVVQSGSNAGTNAITYADGTYAGVPDKAAPGGTAIDVDTTVGMIKLTDTDRHTKITFRVVSVSILGAVDMQDLFGFAIVTERVVCPVAPEESAVVTIAPTTSTTVPEQTAVIPIGVKTTTTTTAAATPSPITPSCVDSYNGTVQFWNTTFYRYTGNNILSTVPDGLGGSVQIAFMVVGASPFVAPNLPSPVRPDPDVVAAQGNGNLANLDYEWASTVKVTTVPRPVTNFTIIISFAGYKATAANGGASGATFGGTLLAFSNFQAGGSNGVTTIQIVPEISAPAYNNMTFMAASTPSTVRFDSATGLISGVDATQNAKSGVVFVRMPDAQRYQRVRLVVSMKGAAGANVSDSFNFGIATEMFNKCVRPTTTTAASTASNSGVISAASILGTIQGTLKKLELNGTYTILSNVNITAINTATNETVAWAMTNDVGYYVIKDLPPAKYRTEVVASTLPKHKVEAVGLETTGYIPTNYTDIPFKNIACFKASQQSSTDFSAFASRAVDCRQDSDFTRLSCTQTRVERDPWWALNLGAKHIVRRVRVYNRNDKSEMLDGFTVVVDATTCGDPKNPPNKAPPAGGFSEVDCRNATGQIVRISLQGVDRPLSMCEVEVDGIPLAPQTPTPTPTPTPIASAVVATSSSITQQPTPTSALPATIPQVGAYNLAPNGGLPLLLGRVPTSGFLEGTTAVTQVECRDKCMKNDQCRVFTHNPLTRACKFYNSSNDMEFTVTETGTTMYAARWIRTESFPLQPHFQCWRGPSLQYRTGRAPASSTAICESLARSSNAAYWGFDSAAKVCTTWNNCTIALNDGALYQDVSARDLWRLESAGPTVCANVSELIAAVRLDANAGIQGCVMACKNTTSCAAGGFYPESDPITKIPYLTCTLFRKCTVRADVPGTTFNLFTLQQVDPTAACGLPAIQSSTLQEATLATDCKNDTAPKTCAAATPSADPWWEVELPRLQLVDYVDITNSEASALSGSANALDGFQLTVDNKTCGLESNLAPRLFQRYRCGQTGKKVRISLPGQDRKLSLCEVRVFARDYQIVPPTSTPPETTATSSSGSVFNSRRRRSGEVEIEGLVSQPINLKNGGIQVDDMVIIDKGEEREQETAKESVNVSREVVVEPGKTTQDNVKVKGLRRRRQTETNLQGSTGSGVLDLSYGGTVDANFEFTGSNPCTGGTHQCHASATCTYQQTYYTCNCNAGYSGNGTMCWDDNECSYRTHNCDPHATCTNTAGSFTCACSAQCTAPGDGTVGNCGGCESLQPITSCYSTTQAFTGRMQNIGAFGKWFDRARLLFNVPIQTDDSGYCLVVDSPSYGKFIYNCNHGRSLVNINFDPTKMEIAITGPLVRCQAGWSPYECDRFIRLNGACDVDFNYKVSVVNGSLIANDLVNPGGGTISCYGETTTYAGKVFGTHSFQIKATIFSKEENGRGWLVFPTQMVNQGDWTFTAQCVG